MLYTDRECKFCLIKEQFLEYQYNGSLPVWRMERISKVFILSLENKMKVILIPGMGCTPIDSSNWYLWFRDQVRLRSNAACDLYSYPDPYKCRESIWVPFIRTKIDTPAETILVGHSTGAACAMRLLEYYGKKGSTPIKACILVAAAHTDLGDDDERESEYFNRPWDWESMQHGCMTPIILFHGTDDPLIPVSEARYIAEQLTTKYCDYRERKGRSHFFRPWDELLEAIDARL